jgi:hypothetical protein
MKVNGTFVAVLACAALACIADVGMMAVGDSSSSQLVRDLRVSHRGNKVTLTWSQSHSVPSVDSSSANVIVARVCRNILPAPPTAVGVAEVPTSCAKSVGEVDLRKRVAPHGDKKNEAARFQFVDSLPENEEESDSVQFAVYRLKLEDARGHAVGFSNAASVPLAPIAPAKGLHTQLDVRGVYLIWDNETENHSPSLEFDYRIYRSNKKSKPVAIPYVHAMIHTQEGERWSAVDTNIEWDTTYSYFVTPVTRVLGHAGEQIAEIEGEESAPVEVTTHHVFPPAVPERLLAVVTQRGGKNFVDLLWAPNAEKDISKYNVYRRDQNGEAVRIQSVPMNILSFQDTDVAAAHTYSYSVSAVDRVGLESAKSQEAMAVLR